jgi:hypothetical protein
MKRRLFSLSLFSALSTLPSAVRRVFALSAEENHTPSADLLIELLSAQPQPAGTAALLPIGFEGDPFGLTAFTETGEMITQTVSIDLTPPRTPEVSAKVDVPLIEHGAFPPVQEPFRVVEGTADFGAEVGMLPYSVIGVRPDRAWTAKGVRVAATGERLTVRTMNGSEAPLIITEQLGVTQLNVTVSLALRQLLKQRGVNVDELINNAKTPNLRQRMLKMSGGEAQFRTPDPPLDPAVAVELQTVQVIIWSPVPITIVDREG